MIATAVNPIAMPPATRLVNSSGTSCSSTPNMHADTMKAPSAAPSLRYSGKCLRSVSALPCLFAIAMPLACTPSKDATIHQYSVEYFDLAGGCSGSMNRRNVLIETNIRWLCQALALLGRIDDAVFTTSPAGMEPHRAGAHLRHIVEFYQAFLEGVGSYHIDYDARRRNAEIERSRAAASAAIGAVILELRTGPALRFNATVWVRMEDAPAGASREPFMESSIDRELQVLSSHTIHHFALIAMTLRLHGVDMPPDFGMAPSTLRHQAARSEAA